MLEVSGMHPIVFNRSVLIAAAALSLVACGNPPEPKQPVLQTKPVASAAPTAAEGAGGAEAEDAEKGAGGGDAKADTEKEAETKPPARRSSRPAAVYGPTKKISSTFGTTPGSILRLKAKGGSFTLKLPEFALPAPTNITFELARSLRGGVRVIGSATHLTISKPQSTKLSAVRAADSPFQIYVPLNGNDSVNLAVGQVALDDAGQEKAKVSSWKVYAPKRVDSGLKQAYFELSELGPASYIYATNKAPTDEAK